MKKKKIKKYVEKLLDTPFCEEQIIEIFIFIMNGKLINIEDNLLLNIIYQTDDGDIIECDMNEIVDTIRKYMDSKYIDDINHIYKFIENKVK